MAVRNCYALILTATQILPFLRGDKRKIMITDNVFIRGGVVKRIHPYFGGGCAGDACHRILRQNCLHWGYEL